MAAYNKRKVLLLILLRRRLARRAKRCWIKKINRSRLLKGEYHSLIQEMRLSDHESFYKYFRMTPQRFDHLLSLVGPLISHQETKFRAPVSANERLAVTLRYLATGDSMQTIAFSYRLGHSTVCNIIDHTCDKKFGMVLVKNTYTAQVVKLIGKKLVMVFVKHGIFQFVLGL